MSKHTTGPWVIDPKYLSEVQTPDMLTIASCWHEHAVDKEITITGVLPCSLEESASNARLIAAAPDLLDSLRDCLDRIVEAFPDLKNYGPIKRGYEAIAKAEGRP